ncbi:urease accessory protein UreD [Arenibacter amylolyticus]|uniref:urease accessory protein UreD n=1 Tax=Arenibacter amylolyticus TaxID=1406873 RepID=UPI000A36D9AB|nr:urease accessory protein UreD [Arenibacter amylolyticus]
MGRYSVQTDLYKDITILKDTYFTPPFNVVEVRENKKNPLLELMIMSSSPGFFNNDNYQIDIKVKKETLLNLQTQSYQRIYDTPDGAQQHMRVNVECNAYFSHLPHPSVPHKGAIFESDNRIYLSDTSVLIWGEILACGRKLNGESFAFKKYRSLTQVFRKDKLLYKDNLYLNPSKVNYKTMGQYEEFSYQANFICVDPHHSPKEHMANMAEKLEGEEDIIFGFSQISDDACVLRVLGNSGEQLFRALKKIQKQLDKQAGDLRQQQIDLKI